MLRRYRNELIEMIVEAGLDPKEFRPSDQVMQGLPAFVLRYQDSPLFFAIRTSRQNAHDLDYCFSRLSPDFPTTQYLPQGEWATFQSLSEIFTDWLHDSVKEYIQELRTPDKWAELSEDIPILDNVAVIHEDNSPLSKEEQERIRDSFERMLAQVRDQQTLSGEQMQLLEAKVDYIIGSSERLGRKDWASAALGTLMALTVEAALNADATKELLKLAGAALRWALQNPHLISP